MKTDKEFILGFPKEIKIKCLEDALKQNNLSMFLGLSNILLEAPLNKGGLETEIIESIHNEYILRTKKRWLKNKITAHWQSLGKVVVFVYREFSTKTVTIDYYGGPSTKYTYDGKWICG